MAIFSRFSFFNDYCHNVVDTSALASRDDVALSLMNTAALQHHLKSIRFQQARVIKVRPQLARHRGDRLAVAPRQTTTWLADVSRHKSVDTLRGYGREADAFRDHAGAGLL
jgi:hypothetical protein